MILKIIMFIMIKIHVIIMSINYNDDDNNTVLIIKKKNTTATTWLSL